MIGLTDAFNSDGGFGLLAQRPLRSIGTTALRDKATVVIRGRTPSKVVW